MPLLAICLLGWSIDSAPGGAGYLLAVGPAPVRFQTRSPQAPVVLWPPLLQPEQQTVNSEAQITNAPPAETAGLESPTNAIPASMTAANAPAAPPPPIAVLPFPMRVFNQAKPATDSVVDPQALLTYLLTVSTNEPGTKIIMPLFVPPAPPSPYPSSHATYESQ